MLLLLPSLPTNSITTWNELKKAFLASYSHQENITVLSNHITTFEKNKGESLFEAWERYKDMMRLCPYHGLEKWFIIHTLYNGMMYNTIMTIDVAASGALMEKPFNEGYQLIKNMAQNHYQWGTKRAQV